MQVLDNCSDSCKADHTTSTQQELHDEYTDRRHGLDLATTATGTCLAAGNAVVLKAQPDHPASVSGPDTALTNVRDAILAEDGT